VGGLGTHVFELTNGLSRVDCDVTVFAPSNSGTRIHREPNITIHMVAGIAGAPNQSGPSWRLKFNRLNSICVSYASNLIKNSNFRPDIIHCHEWHGFPAAKQLRQMFKIPVIGTVHLLQHPVQSSWGVETPLEIVNQEKQFCRNADALITVSESMLTLIMSTHSTPAAQLNLIYNGMDPRPFANSTMSVEEPRKLRAKYALPHEKIVIFAGRLSPQKGIYSLFESVRQLIKQWPNVRYLVAGEPDISSETWSVERITETMRAMFPQYHSVAEKLTILGKVARAELAQLYHVADIAIVPSIYEPFGYAAIEAMAAGVPVVATAVGGLPEIIQDQVTGLLVPVQTSSTGPTVVDVEKLTAAQLLLLKEAKLAKRLGRAGQDHAINTFGLQQMVEKTYKVYQRYAGNGAH
jgi:glycosyltransferase involved in cell wall biosynthesis